MQLNLGWGYTGPLTVSPDYVLLDSVMQHIVVVALVNFESAVDAAALAVAAGDVQRVGQESVFASGLTCRNTPAVAGVHELEMSNHWVTVGRCLVLP